ncbi:SusC/RagA family TonB-linked outer membrane protein [Chitinophaga caseinilytica]|uniref:SusC/RagA family TonB-linked outer membrane protein n=2 Tax=Chitinophaga caseinilytica TaxID=2267521 RepID=A0ABZ2ZCM7_9BACT
MVKGEPKGGVTNGEGRFRIEKVLPKSTLVINSIGFLSRQYRLDGERKVTFILEPAVSQIEPVEITANTGYQVLKKKETPGAVAVIDSVFINRSTGLSILDRLEGGASGILMFRTAALSQFVPKLPLAADMGMYIRGLSTINSNRVNPNPLFVLDNFPYEGNIKNINANDIASITILKDATAAGVWGARSGNGVIVLTTKKGQYKEKMKVDFSTSLTFVKKPNWRYDRSNLNATDYIEVERYLYQQGYFASDFADQTNFYPISPAVEIFDRRAKGELTQAEEERLLDRLRKNDLRADIAKYSYRNALNQQYSISVRGGTKDFAYYVSLGHDRNQANMVRNRNERTTIVSSNQFKPIKNLEVTAMLNYSQQKIEMGNEIKANNIYMMGGKYRFLYPYASLYDETGAAASYARDIRKSFADSMQSLGFLDWSFRPAEEIYNTHNNFSLQNLLLRASVKYSFLKCFNIDLSYQNERQMVFSQKYSDGNSAYSRNLVNTFSVYNSNTRTITQGLPEGGIMAISDYDWQANSLRGSVGFQRQLNSHIINATVGGEIRELSASGFDRVNVGYENIKGIPVTNLNPNISLPLTPTGTATINDKISLSGENEGLLNRYLSYYAIVNYNLLRKYDFTILGRKDGTNLFGARTNNRIQPFWSSGGGWHIDKEAFFRSKLINQLRLRASVGENGNIYNGSAYVTANRGTDQLTGLPNSIIANPANEDLSWEKVKIRNLGVDFAILKHRISGSLDVYSKKSSDLVEQINLAPQTGYTSALVNSAAMKVKGLEVTLNGNLKIRRLDWFTKLYITYMKDELVKYDKAPVRQTMFLNDPGFETILVKEHSLKGIFSYRWAGLDPKTGDPQGYLNGEVSKDYTRILNNINPDSLNYHGSAAPQLFGIWRNDFTFHNFTFSFSLNYKFKYFFRRPTTEINYADIIGKLPNEDYGKRWQVPGDELRTNVPSIVYPANISRSQFYQRSAVLVERGDHIRLQDIRVSYLSPMKENGFIKNFEFFAYLNNLGILWRANKYGLDPDVAHLSTFTNFNHIPSPFSASIGLIMKL